MTRLRSKGPAKADGQKIVAQPRRPGRAPKFDEILELIEAARRRAYQAVNSELVGLYWELGAYISKKIASAEWGDGVVDELAATIAREYPGMRGYTRPNLFRMRQFYEAYRGDEKVSPLVRQLPWTHHLIILGQTKVADERHFYMLAAVRGKWTKRELDRQIRTGAALRGEATALTPTRLPTPDEVLAQARHLEQTLLTDPTRGREMLLHLFEHGRLVLEPEPEKNAYYLARSRWFPLRALTPNATVPRAVGGSGHRATASSCAGAIRGLEHVVFKAFSLPLVA